MFRDKMFNDVVDYVTHDVHHFMEALTLNSPVAVNDNAANENEASPDTPTRPEVAA